MKIKINLINIDLNNTDQINEYLGHVSIHKFKQDVRQLRMAKTAINNLLRTIENNATDNKAIISNVSMFLKSWRREF